MRYTKTYYIHRTFCYGILVIFVIICPFFLVADQHGTGSEFQETSDEQHQNPVPLTRQDPRASLNGQQEMDEQHQNPVPLTRQDLRALLNGQQEMSATQSLAFLAGLTFLFFAILIFFAWMFCQYRDLAGELDSIKREIEKPVEVDSSLKQGLLEVSDSIQTLAKTFDSEALYQKALYQKLAARNESNTQQVLNLLQLITDILQNEPSLNLPETVESSQQHESGIDECMLPPAIAEFCNRYNAGVKDKQEWTNFLEDYGENYEITVVNVEERYLNPQLDIDPIFRTDSAGYFLACYVEEERLYAVVPVYDLVVERSTYTPGAFGDVFKCSNFDPQRYYRILKIIQPAVFEPDDAKETWGLKANGILELREI